MIMYESFFSMNNTPFSKDIPADRLYEPKAVSEALARLSYTADRQMFAVVTAEPGCGKSTLLRKFSSMLPKDDYVVLYLSDSKLTPRWFYKGLLEQIGFESRFYRGDSKQQLQQQLEVIRGVHHKKVICILDEAHLLDKETLEEFRFLLNTHYDSVSPLSLILVGQTELWDCKLKKHHYSAIRQRIDMYCTLPPLSRSEAEQYIRCHLDYAGGAKDIFTDKAVDEIYRASSGIMRMINRICEKSLMYASQQQKRLIDDHMIRFVVENEIPGGGCL